MLSLVHTTWSHLHDLLAVAGCDVYRREVVPLGMSSNEAQGQDPQEMQSQPDVCRRLRLRA